MSDDNDQSGGEPNPSRQMLEEALEGLSREDIEREKFGEPERGLDIDPDEHTSAADDGGGSDDDTDSEVSSEEAAGESDRERQLRREQEMFERAMSDVERMEPTSKYRSPATPNPDEAAERASAVGGRSPDDLNTPTLPKSGEELRRAPPFDDRQKAFKNRFEAWSSDNQTPEINLRGETTEDAVSRLSSFLAQARHHDSRFVRVVTGRGRRSDGPPAIKLAVLEWLETRGIAHIEGYIPERLVDGDYGSLIVELRD